MAEVHGFCNLCRSSCGTINTVEDGRLISVRPDPEHPTGKAMCMKGKAAPEIIAGASRLLYPMRRTNPKTDPDPGWERISWDEALDICATRLDAIRRESGPEAVAFSTTTKSGTAISDSLEWIYRLIRVFGSPNIAGAVEVCNWHTDRAHKFTFGVLTPTADYSGADLIMLWGHNPTSTWLAQSEAIQRGRAQGAALIVIDPRATPLAASADVWLRVTPGSDAALAMGLSSLLMAEGGFDKDFVRDWTNAPYLVDDATGLFLRGKDVGLGQDDDLVVWDVEAHAARAVDTRLATDPVTGGNAATAGSYTLTLASGGTASCTPAFQLFKDACDVWSPANVALATGVSEGDLRRAAALIARSSKIASHGWSGVNQSTNATQAERAIATLYALKGTFDQAGGNRIYAKHRLNVVDSLSLIPQSQLDKAIGVRDRPLGPASEGRVKSVDMYRSIAKKGPGAVRAIVGFGSNQLSTQCDTDVVRLGLESAEFHVHCDIVETPTARYADIVLPVNTPFEREALRVGFEISQEAEELIMFRPALVPPRGESRSDVEIVFALATRLGFGDMFFGGNVNAGWDHMLEPLGLTVEELKRHPKGIRRPLVNRQKKYAQPQPDGGVAGFQTPTRRVEFYSDFLLRHGYSPVPTFRMPTIQAEFPLVLTSIKSGYYCHSQFRGIASLRQREPDPVVFMHPEVAAARGISEGDWTCVRSAQGKAHFVARLDPSLAPGVMAAEFGWWEGSEPLGRDETGILSARSSNFNSLVSGDARDPVSGSVDHKRVMCEISPDHSLGMARWNGFRPLVVGSVHRETADAIEIELRDEAGRPLPDYLPGQYVQVRVGAHIRSYSLIGNARDAGRTGYRICVGRNFGAVDAAASLSHHLHGLLKVGDTVDVRAPAGVFTLPVKSSVPLVFIATGIGITPFMSQLETMAQQPCAANTLLLYGNRNGAGHAYKERLRELQERNAGLRIVDFYSAPQSGDVAGEDYDHAGRVTASYLAGRTDLLLARFYLCGSAQMIADVSAGLIALGVPRFNVFSEVFQSPVLPAPSDDVFTVEFRRSGVSAAWSSADGSLLDFAETKGIGAPSGCRVGQCESCQVAVLEGRVVHLNGAGPQDRRLMFACQGVPASDLVLDL
ncbi:MAG: 2Fe-2S iron-sulfur cluster binding domain-containing protein [Comamonadaceae bacterium]|nr:MAG: 2Fe-2S iron-sulfur cluster binding domain-containing protein [Comamonadaceae bacterium]